MSAQVFLSYAREDEATARAVAKALEERSVTTWLDEAQVDVGEPIFRRIQEAISRASVVVAILSDRPTQSPWVLFEVGAAFGMGKPVITLLVGDRRGHEMPEWLRTVQTVDARGRSLQQVVEQISHELSKAQAG